MTLLLSAIGARRRPVAAGEYIPPQYAGWRYKQVTATDTTDYSGLAVDDTSWSIGAAPFGSWEDGTASTSLPPAFDSRLSGTFATNWTTDTKLWMRRTLNLDRAQAFNCRGYFEDHVHFYVNGVLAFSTPYDPATNGYDLAAGLFVAGDNQITLMCEDEAVSAGISLVYCDFLLYS